MSRTSKLKPAGHSAFVEGEGLITPLIVIGSSLLSLVAAYVLGEDFLRAILAGQGTAFDGFMVLVCAGLGLMVDTATIVSATRFKMHLLRGRQDRLWQLVSAGMLALCLAVETMTLSYFFYLIAPATIPPGLVSAVQTIHDVLFFIRALMPPLVIVYFVAGVLPVVIERADRDRDLKSKTSQAIGVLTERMLSVDDVQTADGAIRLLAAQLELNAYAANDGDSERQRYRELVERLAALQGVAWPPAVPGEAAPATSFPPAVSLAAVVAPAAADRPADTATPARAAALMTSRAPRNRRDYAEPDIPEPAQVYRTPPVARGLPAHVAAPSAEA